MEGGGGGTLPNPTAPCDLDVEDESGTWGFDDDEGTIGAVLRYARVLEGERDLIGFVCCGGGGGTPPAVALLFRTCITLSRSLPSSAIRALCAALLACKLCVYTVSLLLDAVLADTALVCVV